MSVHRCGSSRPRLSPFGTSARSLDRPDLHDSDNRCRRRSLLAHGSQLGSLADARLARLSRCRERISLAVGIYTACSAVDDSRLCPIGAAYFQIFSVCAIRLHRSLAWRVLRTSASNCSCRAPTSGTVCMPRDAPHDDVLAHPINFTLRYLSISISRIRFDHLALYFDHLTFAFSSSKALNAMGQIRMFSRTP